MATDDDDDSIQAEDRTLVDVNVGANAADGDAIHKNFPSVVRMNGNWVKLRCSTCSTNSGRADGKFLNGLKGFRWHAIHSHQLRSDGIDISQYCVTRRISQRDVDLLRQGKQAHDHRITTGIPKENLTVFVTPGYATPQGSALAAHAGPAKHFEQIHANFPTVIDYEGKWVELSCRKCGSNSYWDGSRYIAGPGGFVGHAQRAHQIQCNTNDITSYFTTNWSYGNNRFIRGAKGLAHHVARTHKISVQVGEVERYSNVRLVTDRDRNLLSQGHNGVDQPITGVLPAGDHTGDASIYEAQQDQTAAPAQRNQIHPSFPTIVHLHGAWVEISCKFCDANFSRNKNRYMSGVPGILHHVRLAHAEENSSNNVEQGCNIRPVSARDQGLLVQGLNAVDQPIEKVSAGLINPINSSAKRKRDTQVRTPADSSSDDASVRETGRWGKRRRTVGGISVDDDGAYVEIKREPEEENLYSSDAE